QQQRAAHLTRGDGWDGHGATITPVADGANTTRRFSSTAEAAASSHPPKCVTRDRVSTVSRDGEGTDQPRLYRHREALMLDVPVGGHGVEGMLGAIGLDELVVARTCTEHQVILVVTVEVADLDQLPFVRLRRDRRAEQRAAVEVDQLVLAGVRRHRLLL